MESNIVEQSVLDAIREILESKKKRPDKQSISSHLLKTMGLAMATTLEVIDMLLMEKKIITKKLIDGKYSLYKVKPTVVDAAGAVVTFIIMSVSFVISRSALKEFFINGNGLHFQIQSK